MMFLGEVCKFFEVLKRDMPCINRALENKKKEVKSC